LKIEPVQNRSIAVSGHLFVKKIDCLLGCRAIIKAAGGGAQKIFEVLQPAQRISPTPNTKNFSERNAP
jgi:hypothetical protein